MDVTLFNIQKFSMQDGPGIRTTVFLKGCPLRCKWCHNPESIAFEVQRVFNEKKCIGCQRCEDDAIENCPTEAKKNAGYISTVDDVLTEIYKDQVFYEESGGGVTFSGGEPLSQGEALLTLLKSCKAKGYHTAVDTSGYAPWSVIERILPYTDLFLYDLKHMDSEVHLKWTGVSNRMILDNLKRLAKRNSSLWIRLPIIQGLNDSPEMIDQLGAFLGSLSPEVPFEVYLLPYHELGISKYKQLGITYDRGKFEAPSRETLISLQKQLESYSLVVKQGGYND